jgi:hypothetical protein
VQRSSNRVGRDKPGHDSERNRRIRRISSIR